MIIIKFISLTAILLFSSYIGIIISNKYKNRVEDLKEIKRGLNIFETKIKYTYEPVPEIFKEISGNLKENIANIFINASRNMHKNTAKDAWDYAIEVSNTSMNKEDKEVIKGLGKLLGKTDLDGQVSQIELTDIFIDTQIEKAEKEYTKNEKLYKTLRSCFWTCISYSAYIKT
ncbi:MAG: hypothetical protein HFJ58_04490 [Clostridia bacterium]|nr:hypothetical protein [Clostridia bacterium]